MLGPAGRSQRERGARPASSLEKEGGPSREDQEPSRQQQARGGGAHGPRPVGIPGPPGNDSAQENADNSQEHEASGAAVRSGRLGPDELHDENRSNDRAARPEGRAKIAFGVTSCGTPASETFVERRTPGGRSCQRPDCNREISSRQREIEG